MKNINTYFLLVCCILLINGCKPNSTTTPVNTIDKNTLVGFWAGSVTASFNVLNTPVPDIAYIRRYIQLSVKDPNQLIINDTFINAERNYFAVDSNIGIIVGNDISLNNSTLKIKFDSLGINGITKTIHSHKATVINNNQIMQNTTFTGNLTTNGNMIPINGNFIVDIKFISKVYNLNLLKPN